jgi:hypothetical protein
MDTDLDDATARAVIAELTDFQAPERGQVNLDRLEIIGNLDASVADRPT